MKIAFPFLGIETNLIEPHHIKFSFVSIDTGHFQVVNTDVLTNDFLTLSVITIGDWLPSTLFVLPGSSSLIRRDVLNSLSL